MSAEKEAWQVNAEVGNSVMLWGAPGVGKTAAVAAYAREVGAHLEVLVGSQLDPSDICRQAVIGNELELLAPPWARRLAQALKNGQRAILMLDELLCAPRAVRAALLRVSNEKQVGDVPLDDMTVIGASNPVELAADGSDFDAATANRWAHHDFVPNAEKWRVGEASGWGKKLPRPDSMVGDIVAWISHNSGALLQVPKIGSDTNAWPSPRSWSNVAKLPKNASARCIEALVGKAAACEFTTWRNIMDVPHPEQLLSGAVSVPARGDIAYVALTNAVVYALPETERMEKLMNLLIRQRSDIQLSMGRFAVKSLNSAGTPLPDCQSFHDMCQLVRSL